VTDPDGTTSPAPGQQPGAGGAKRSLGRRRRKALGAHEATALSAAVVAPPAAPLPDVDLRDLVATVVSSLALAQNRAQAMVAADLTAGEVTSTVHVTDATVEFACVLRTPSAPEEPLHVVVDAEALAGLPPESLTRIGFTVRLYHGPETPVTTDGGYAEEGAQP